VEICNVFIQNEYWCEVVNFGSHENSVDFAWGSAILAEKMSFVAFKIKEQDESFKIPVT
jgi:hypothetical protein